eukprot:scaffold299973_cov21-Tisochrysis_lutea.AAC.1
MSGVSTASMGKFDKTLKGEKPGERQPLGKRRKFLSATDTKAERGQVRVCVCVCVSVGDGRLGLQIPVRPQTPKSSGV